MAALHWVQRQERELKKRACALQGARVRNMASLMEQGELGGGDTIPLPSITSGEPGGVLGEFNIPCWTPELAGGPVTSRVDQDSLAIMLQTFG